MALVERLIGDDSIGEDEKLSIHAIGATFRLLQSSLITKDQALARWPELTGEDLADLDALADQIEAGTLTYDDFAGGVTLGEAGKATATEIRTILGL